MTTATLKIQPIAQTQPKRRKVRTSFRVLAGLLELFKAKHGRGYSSILAKAIEEYMAKELHNPTPTSQTVKYTHSKIEKVQACARLDADLIEQFKAKYSKGFCTLISRVAEDFMGKDLESLEPDYVKIADDFLGDSEELDLDVEMFLN